MQRQRRRRSAARRRRDATLWRESNNSLRRKRHMLSGTDCGDRVVDAATVIAVAAARRWHSATDRRPFTFSNNNL